jgi:hypothetical protein
VLCIYSQRSTAQSAMKAAEIFSYGQYWDIERLVWLDQEDNWYFSGVGRTATI